MSQINQKVDSEAPLDQLIRTLQVQELSSMKTIQIAIDKAKSVVGTPWLARTQWLERYVGVDMEKLVEIMEQPKNEEWMLNVWTDVGIVVERTYSTRHMNRV